VRPDFVLDEKTTEIVAEVCRRLDGLPLALELAAARAKLLSPRVMLARLENRLDLLRADERDRPARHRTLREVIGWSYVLLTDDERTFFTRLAVFGGGISIEAAEAVGGTEQAFDVLTSLSNKSLLRHEEQPDGDARFLFLETVREFALERLREAGQESSARHAARAWCIAFAERATTHLRGPSQLEWFDRIQREYANLHAALGEAIAEGPRGLTDAARLGTALHRFWLSRGPIAEGVDFLNRIVAASDALPLDSKDAIPASTRAKLFNATALMMSALSMFPEMRELLTRSLAVHREARDTAEIAVTLNNLGWAIWIIGDLDTAESLSTEAMEIHREHGNELGVALSLNNLAWIAMERGQYAIGEQRFTDAIAIHRKRGDQRTSVYCLTWLGLLVSLRGDYPRALALHTEALSIPSALTDDGPRVLCMIRIASLRHRMREPGDHTADIETIYLPRLRERGGLWPIAAGLAELGTMLLDLGHIDRARAAFEEEMSIRRRMGARQGMAEAQVMLARVLHRQGDVAGAVALLTEALEGARSMGTLPTVSAAERALAELHIS
jgi:tetratricopeptide (TPR) repeat protein